MQYSYVVVQVVHGTTLMPIICLFNQEKKFFFHYKYLIDNREESPEQSVDLKQRKQVGFSKQE